MPYGSRSRRRDYHWSLRRLPLAAFRRLRPQRRGCRPRTRQTGKAVQKTRTCAEYLRQARYSLTAYFTRRGDSILRINRDYVPRYGCAGGDWTVFSKQLIELFDEYLIRLSWHTSASTIVATSRVLLLTVRSFSGGFLRIPTEFRIHGGCE